MYAAAMHPTQEGHYSKKAMSTPSTLLFFKQYGERRTGTNFLRALLLRHFRDIVVLMHILGDKHAEPVDLSALLQRPEEAASDYQLIRQATEHTPAETTNLSDPAQEAYLRSIAESLGAAIRNNRLHLLVSLKDPYAWAVSYMRYYGWWPKGLPPRLPEQMLAQLLAEACDGFNQKYTAWVALGNRWPEKTSFVQYEDLLANGTRVLLQLQQKHGVQCYPVPPDPIKGIVLPTHWDNEPTMEHFVRFDAQFYRRRAYLTHLTPRIHQVVSERIDWSLMQPFGYERLEW